MSFKTLGEGSYGKVVVETGSNIARKVVDKDIYGVREFALLNMIDHPNVIKGTLSTKTSALPESVLEGRDFKDVVTLDMPVMDGSLSKYRTKDITTFIWKLICVIGELNNARIYHRDIKPDNVLYKGDEPYIIDFGLASTNINNIPEYNREVYTLKFRPPELTLEQRIQSIPVDYSKCDTFALAITIIDWLCDMNGKDDTYTSFVTKNAKFFDDNPNVSSEDVHRLYMNYLYDDLELTKKIYSLPIDSGLCAILFGMTCKDPAVRYDCMQIVKLPYFSSYTFKPQLKLNMMPWDKSILEGEVPFSVELGELFDYCVKKLKLSREKSKELIKMGYQLDKENVFNSTVSVIYCYRTHESIQDLLKYIFGTSFDYESIVYINKYSFYLLNKEKYLYFAEM